ncbi:hypothetical protein D6779_10485 [Candidatus Parcubacteria bacterium]|nr:MAG: hypothetical protein D6779_10485 [Candidatus Parcubacteria bacterium]
MSANRYVVTINYHDPKTGDPKLVELLINGDRGGAFSTAARYMESLLSETPRRNGSMPLSFKVKVSPESALH